MIQVCHLICIHDENILDSKTTYIFFKKKGVLEIIG